MSTVTIAKAAEHVADTVGYRIPVSTVRSWANVDLFAPYLSEDANPPAGTTRRFTGHDLATLVRIAEYRQENLTYEQIADRLATPSATPAPVEHPQEPQEPPQGALQRLDLTEVAAIIQTSSAQFEPRLAELDARIKRVESGNRVTVALVAGFIAGALIVGIVAVIVVLLLR